MVDNLVSEKLEQIAIDSFVSAVGHTNCTIFRSRFIIDT